MLGSLVACVHNRQFRVRYLIDSFLQQNPLDIELVLVDDGSYDDTWEVMNSPIYDDERIVLVSISREEKVEHFKSMLDLVGVRDHPFYEKAIHRISKFNKTGRTFAVNDAHALNVAVSHCLGKILIKGSGDYMIDPSTNLQETFQSYSDIEESFVAVQWARMSNDIEDDPPCLLHGLFATQKDTFWKIGGYDERILCRALHADEFLDASGVNTYGFFQESGIHGVCFANPAIYVRNDLRKTFGQERGDKVADTLHAMSKDDVWYRPEYDHSEVMNIWKEWISSKRLGWKRCINEHRDLFSYIPLQEID